MMNSSMRGNGCLILFENGETWSFRLEQSGQMGGDNTAERLFTCAADC